MITNKFVRRTTVPVLVATMILAACGGDKPEEMLASAKDYLAKNDSKAAVIQIKNALQKNPELPEARFLLGKALLESGDAVAAAVELRKAVDLKYPAEQVTPLLAKSILAQGQFKKLVDEFGKVELASPESNADLRTTLAMAHIGLGNLESATASLTTALVALPDYVPALLIEARLKAGNRDFSGALAVADAVIAKAAANQEAWKLKGDILNAKGEVDSAIVAYRKALELKQDFVAAHAALIATLFQQAKLDDAGKQLEAMKKVAPKHPQTLYLEAQFAYQKKDFKSARELAQQLLKFAPDNPNSLQLAGAVELQLKSMAQAEAYLAKAVQLAPELGLARRMLILTYLRTGQPAKALNTLQPVLGKIEKDPNMLALAGEVSIQNGDIQKAEEYFSKASALDPKDAAKRTSVALTHLLKGNSDNAYNELEQIAASDTGTTADLALISSHLRRNDFDRALKAIAVLEKKQPNNPLAYTLRGRTLLGKQDVTGARKSFEQALSVSPVYFPAAASLASLDLAEKKPDDAKKRFDAVLAADAKNVQALLALAQLRAQTDGTPDDVAALISKAITLNPTEVAPRLALIDLYLRNKDVKKAISAAQDAATALPDSAEILDALGRTQQVAGDINQSLATFNKLAGMQPNSPQPYLRMAEVHLAAKNRDGAAQSLRRALEVKPDLVEAQGRLIMLDVQAGKSDDAIAMAREVEKQRPKEGIGYMLEGDVGASRKSWADAAAAYRAGLKQVSSPELAVKLHSVLLAGENKGEADKFASSWLKDHPKDAAFRFYMADGAGARKDYETAAVLYRSILDLQPNNAVAFNNLAWVTGQQKGPKAIEYAEKANKLAPNQPAFMDTLAMLLLEKGETTRAVELLQKAVELAPQTPPIRLNLAKALIKANNKAGAKKELEELTKLGDKFPAQAEVGQLIKAL